MSIIEPRSAVVPIYQGDILDRLKHLEREHEAAVEADAVDTRTLGDVNPALELANRYSALRDEAEAGAVRVTLVALGRRVWRALVGAHPPREGNEADQFSGVNLDTFKDALVPVSLAEPTLSEDDLDALSDVDYDRIFWTAFNLNRAGGSSPKVLQSSHSTRESEEI